MTTEPTILFLDIDGVLNHSSMHRKLWDRVHAFDPACVARINRLMEHLNCGFVLSSTWRHHPDWRMNLESIGLEVWRCHGRTSLDSDFTRGEQILEWLGDSGKTRTVAQRWLVIDDEENDIVPPIHPDRLLRTNNRVGFTDDDRLAVLRRFRTWDSVGQPLETGGIL